MDFELFELFSVTYLELYLAKAGIRNSRNLRTNLQTAGIGRKDLLITRSRDLSSPDHFFESTTGTIGAFNDLKITSISTKVWDQS